MAPNEPETRRKQFMLERRVLAALEALARDRGTSLDSLADEALRDLLSKHRRPLSLKAALRDSARETAANDPAPLRELKPAGKRSLRKT